MIVPHNRLLIWLALVALPAALLGATTVTSAVYHRFWEVWLPLEPPHFYFDVYRNGHQVATPKLQATPTKMAALLFDGRLWLRQRAINWTSVARGQAVSSVRQAIGRARRVWVYPLRFLCYRSARETREKRRRRPVHRLCPAHAGQAARPDDP